MNISDFIEASKDKHGPEALNGAMVFVAMDRPLDNVIRQALSLSSFHPGKPSPWSHCFLLAETYHGSQTAILDCTIRDDRNSIIWNSDLIEDLGVLTKGLEGREGGIYSGIVGDYDNEKVTNCGLCFLPFLNDVQRSGIVTAGRQLQSQGYKYDLPGLLRELVRLLVGLAWKPGIQKLLFCSAFLATTYRQALGSSWNVAPNIASVDVTPDELWYSEVGVRD